MRLTPPNYCWICGKALSPLENSRPDEYGFRVHEECYLKAAKDKDSVIPPKTA
jgi:hypothetical protein